MEKEQAVVARSTSENASVQNKPFSEHFLEVEMWKKRTPLWREAHLEINMYKTRHVRTTFWKLSCGKSARRSGVKHILK